MSVTRLHDDLLQEYKEERRLINAQLEIFDPLGVSLRKPAAQRLLHKGIIIFFEIFCYLLAAGMIAGVVYLYFYIDKLVFSGLQVFQQGVTSEDLAEKLALYKLLGFCLGVLSGILLYIIARMCRRIRLKNNVLYLAGHSIKDLVGQHLQRKASIDAIDQRHFQELPDVMPASSVRVNDVVNPGYEG